MYRERGKQAYYRTGRPDGRVLARYARSVRRAGRTLCTLWITGVAGVVVGCGGAGSDAATRAVDTLEAIGQPLELERTDVDQLIEPSSLTVGRDAFFVADAGAGHVVGYRRDGSFSRWIGSRGNGDGQLIGPTVVSLMQDSLLLVADAALRRLNVFALDRPPTSADALPDPQRASTDRGVYRGAYRLPAQIASLAIRGDTLWMGMQDPAQKTSIGRADGRDSTVRQFGPLPAMMLRYPRIVSAYPHSFVVAHADRLVLVMMGSDMVYTLTTDGILRDSVRLPAPHRIGVPFDLDARLANPAARGNEAAPASLLMSMSTLSNGRTALMHLDLVMKTGAVSARAWLSTLNARGEVTCQDLAIPIAADSRPLFATTADTLFVLQTRTRPQTGLVATMVSRYLIPTCDTPQ